MIPAGLNLVVVAGGPWPVCDWADNHGRHCILYRGHPPIKSPSGPHAPDRPLAAPKPAQAVDPLAMRA
jgi:hypothetical protein